MYVGLFMAMQQKFIACGTILTVFRMVLQFIVRPATMVIDTITIGLHGDVLRIAIIQVNLYKPNI